MLPDVELQDHQYSDVFMCIYKEEYSAFSFSEFGNFCRRAIRLADFEIILDFFYSINFGTI